MREKDHISFVYHDGGKELKTPPEKFVKFVFRKGGTFKTLVGNLSFDAASANLLYEYKKRFLYQLLGNRKKVGALHTKIIDRLSHKNYNLPYGKVRKIKVCGSTFNIISNGFLAAMILIEQIVVDNQYHIFDDPNPVKNKIIIDAGANIGVFSICAARLGVKKIYAFEPVRETFELLKKNIHENGFDDVIIPLNLALGEKKGTGEIFYHFGGDGGAAIVKGGVSTKEVKKARIQITTIDDFIRENKITKLGFLKIDTEGYERFILKGAKNTIKKYRPVICCSAYHFPDDKTILPKIVSGLRPDYECRLENLSEEVFLFY